MLKTNKGFTLLELIIVIIIIGVLASLALPRLFSQVDLARSTEATNFFREIRKGMDWCYTEMNNTYLGCDFPQLKIEDPNATPGAIFAYALSGQSATGYTITATGATPADTIVGTQTAAGFNIVGNGVYGDL